MKKIWLTVLELVKRRHSRKKKMVPTLKRQIQHWETYESCLIFQRNRMATDTN